MDKQDVKFSYLSDDFKESWYGLEKYKGYNLISYPIGHEISFSPTKLKPLNIVVRTTYDIRIFEMGKADFFESENMPYDIFSYKKYLENEAKNSIDLYCKHLAKEKKEVTENIKNSISKAISLKKKQSFMLSNIKHNQKYLDDCISQKQSNIYISSEIKLNNILVGKDKYVDSDVDNGCKDIKKCDTKIKNTILGLKPENIYHLAIPFLKPEEDWESEGVTEEFFVAVKDIIEDTNETVFIRKTVYNNLLSLTSDICYQWRENKEVNERVLDLINAFVDYKEINPYNPVIEFVSLFYNDLIQDILKNKKAIKCNHCGLLAKYFRNKKFCSKDVDKRNCFKNFHSKNDYYTHKEKRLPVKRAWMQKTRKEIKGY